MNQTQMFSVGAVVVFLGGTTFAIRSDRERRAAEIAARVAHIVTAEPDRFEPVSKEAAPPLSLTTSDGRGLVLAELSARAVVEEPVAFTELRLVFDNPADRVIEGTFSITLPPGASVGRFAMKLGEMWQEGEIVEKQAARRAYEDFLHRKQDPALLEQGPGNEFTARVFPIPARGRKELILSYSQELGGRAYALPLRGLPKIGRIDIAATSASGAPLQKLDEKEWTPAADFVLGGEAARLPVTSAVRAGNLFVGRVRPVPDSHPDPLDAPLVLFDTSASRALGFEDQLALLRRLVQRLAEVDPRAPVTVACFDQNVESVYTGDAAGFGEKELAAIRARGALGASDLSGALGWARSHARAHALKRVILIGDGVATAGITEADKLASSAASLRDSGVERIDAIVVGGIKDEGVLRRLTTAGLQRDGAVLDGQLATASLVRRLNESTRSHVPIAVDGATWSWPTNVDGVQAGDDVLVYAELPERSDIVVRIDGRAMPLSTKIVDRPLVERAWAKAKIDSLLATASGAKPEARAETQKTIVDLSIRHRVTTPYTSFLVLETEADYARFKIDRNALTDIFAVEDGRIAVKHRSAPDFGKLSAAKNDEQRVPLIPPVTDPIATPPTTAAAEPSPSSSSPWASAPPGAAPSLEVAGNMWGDQIGDAFGAGGLGLTGTGEGGGGRGEGIGLGNIGSIGHGAGTGTGQGFGNGHGRLGGAHSTNPPSLRMGATQVNGRLPPEVVQRIVRQNFGRFRLCYENGLRDNPTLAGRISVAFTIARDGSVENVRDGGSEMPSSAIISCVVRAFTGLSFPSPEGGTVTVVYPIIFNPGDGQVPPRPLGIDAADPRPSSPKAKIEPYTGRFRDVMSALERPSTDEALGLVQKWRTEAPGDVMALTALGEVYEKRGDLARAERAYGSIIDLFASRADLRRYAGVRLERIKGAGALDLALDSFEKAVVERPDHPQSHRLLAYAHLRKGAMEQAFTVAAAGAQRSYPGGRFAGVDRILKEDLGLIAAAWTQKEPKRAAEIRAKLTDAGGTIEDRPSIRFVLNWETDANDVDFHITDDKGGHAYYGSKVLPSGGELYADVTTGYGPECFTIRLPREARAASYKLEANYYSIGPMGYGMGKLEIVEHDGSGGLRFEERPYVVMVDHAFVDLGTVTR
jgi:tetratricopeptide (TPR) repeat protein